MPSSRGSSQSRYQTCISCVPCIGRQILCHWEARSYSKTFLESSIMPHHGVTQPEYILVILILKLVYVSSLRVGSTSPCPSLTSVWIPNTIPSLASGRHVWIINLSLNFESLGHEKSQCHNIFFTGLSRLWKPICMFQDSGSEPGLHIGIPWEGLCFVLF